MDFELPITTERLSLRDFEPGDESAVHAYGSDPEAVRYMPFGPNTEQETRAFLANAFAKRKERPRTWLDLAVTLRDSGLLIGGCGIRFTKGLSQEEVSFGYILRRDHWRLGYGTEIARALVRFGFEQMKAHRIIAHCDTRNAASARILEKAGMTREGRLRRDIDPGDGWHDSWLYGIVEDEWREARAGGQGPAAP